jgi:hypothetical protein
MIDTRKITASLLSISIVLLLSDRLLRQLQITSGLASACEGLLGVFLTATIIVGLRYAVGRFLGIAFNRRTVQHVSLTSMSVAAGASISDFLVLPFLLNPSPYGVVSPFAQLVLLSGLIAFSASIVLSFFNRKHSANSVNVTSLGDATFYQGKSIVFKREKRNSALCILKLTGWLTSPLAYEREGRLHMSAESGSRDMVAGAASYSHLSSLWNNVSNFGVEFATENGLASVRFFTLVTDSNPEVATRGAERKAEKLKSIFQTRFDTKIEFLQGHNLWAAYGSLLGSDPSSSVEVHGEFLRIDDPQRSKVQYVTASALRGNGELTSMTKQPQCQVEKLLSIFNRERITGSMVIHLEAIAPPSLPSEAKLLEKARNEPDLKVLLELGEKKKEASEERNAQLTGYWKVSAYIVYRSETPAQAKLFQEKGDACIEAIYSSPANRVTCEKLRGRAVAKHLSKLLLRQGMDITTMKASSRIVASLIRLPEQNVVGIQETSIPAFRVPPRDELDSGEVTIGEVMSVENEISPLKLKLEDLMLHTVIFGETGFGKTRLIMKLLQEASKHKIAWTIIEMKGEYKPLTKLIRRVVYLRPGSDIAPLKLSLFDPQGEDPEIHAKKIFTILKETFSTLFTDQNRDLSAQMERVFYEALVSYLTTSSPNEADTQRRLESQLHTMTTASCSSSRSTSLRTWLGFNEWLKNYAERHGLSAMPQINSTIQALLNRLNSFTRAPLSDVFNHQESNTNFNDLVKRRAIIDLSEIKRNGTSEDLRLISNIIAKYVATAAQQRGIQNQLKHLLIIDDALDVVPEILTKKTTAEIGITEQMVLLLRTTGQGVIIATQRPNISQNIVANSATKIFLRTTVDSDKAAKWLNLNEEQTNYLKVMPKREAIIATPRFSGPIRIRTMEMDPPRVTDEEIIMENMVNYPVIYDKITQTPILNAKRDTPVRQDTAGANPIRSETRRLITIAEEALQSGDYKGALRTDIKAIETMKQHQEKGKDQYNPEVSDSQIIKSINTSAENNECPQQLGPRLPLTNKPHYESEKTHLSPYQIQQDRSTPTAIHPQSTDSAPTPEKNQMRSKVKQAFKHQQEIIDETTLQTRLNIPTTQQLRNLTELLIAENLIGEITAPNYTTPYQATRIYYQITDHEARNIMQEYIITTVYKDLQGKGINTRWIDNNMELLITNENQHVITTWTNNIDQDTTLTKLTRIKQELQFEQPRELIIIIPWRKDANKLNKLITQMKLKGILTIPFNENQTDKLINHITMGTSL